MNKLKFKKYFGKNSLSEMLNAFKDYIELVDGFAKLSLCRDEKDDFLFKFSFDGNANYLIIGDQDLLILKQIENTKIITMTDFLTINKLKQL
jgi:putative PIN family toxin of toxin-antitoxin system